MLFCLIRIVVLETVEMHSKVLMIDMYLIV